MILKLAGVVGSQTPDVEVELLTRTPEDRTLRPLSGKYWAVAEPGADSRLRILVRSPSLAGESLSIPDELPGRLAAARGATISYNDPAFFGDGAGIAVRKGDDTLRKALDEAITAIRADGTYQRIAARYFDFDIYGPEPAKK